MAGKTHDPGVSARHADGFAAWLAGRGYALSTVGKHLTLMRRLGQWLADEQLRWRPWMMMRPDASVVPSGLRARSG